MNEYKLCGNCLHGWLKSDEGPEAGASVKIVRPAECEIGACRPEPTGAVIIIDDGGTVSVSGNTERIDVIDYGVEGHDERTDGVLCRCGGFDGHHHEVYLPEAPAKEGA